jgi:RNA polymerase sigma-B factor
MTTSQVRTELSSAYARDRSDRTHELFLLARNSTDDEERRVAMDTVIEMYLDYAHSQASRYRLRGVAIDDLYQVAALALTKAAQRYDVYSGYDFMSYAAPTIRGELRKYFRDYGWMIRPTRRIQELQAQISSAEAELSFTLGRSPRPREIAEYLNVAIDSVTEALATDGCFAPTSLDHPVSGDGSTALGELLPLTGDHARSAVEARMMLEPVLGTLGERDRLILSMRFDEGLTQREIAAKIGVTQMQVSRLLARILAQLRHRIGDVPSR